MVWLTVVLGLLAATVLRGKRHRFAFAALAAGLGCVVALHVLNPHALIARVNISRAAAGAEIDARYLRTLSADAVPTLLDNLDVLPVNERCQVATRLRKRWSGEREGGWRTWNVSDARARRLVDGLTVPTGCIVVKSS
jgi:two-component system, OmpR family, sensor histidine kinase BaeS